MSMWLIWIFPVLLVLFPSINFCLENLCHRQDTLIITQIFCIFLLNSRGISVYAHAMEHWWRSALSVHFMGTGYWTQTVRLVIKNLHPLNHHASPCIVLLQSWWLPDVPNPWATTELIASISKMLSLQNSFCSVIVSCSFIFFILCISITFIKAFL